MLAKWIFVMTINGQSQIVAERPTEALCKQAMVKVLTAQREMGKEAAGACYIQAVDESAVESDLPGPEGRSR